MEHIKSIVQNCISKIKQSSKKDLETRLFDGNKKIEYMLRHGEVFTSDMIYNQLKENIKTKELMEKIK